MCSVCNGHPDLVSRGVPLARVQNPAERTDIHALDRRKAVMTTVSPEAWERALLPLAYEAEHQNADESPQPVRDTALLHRAYAYCASLTARHSRTFSLASGLLPPEKRRAMRALYAFCRTSDDLVDCSREHT